MKKNINGWKISFPKNTSQTLLAKFSFLIIAVCSLLTSGCYGARTPDNYAYQQKRPAVKTRTITYATQGEASWYGGKFHGRKTASGQIYNKYAYTAAHRYLPFGTRVEVLNLQNGRRVIVTINDRGPFAKNRIIDVSYAAALKLNIVRSGHAKVRIRVL